MSDGGETLEEAVYQVGEGSGGEGLLSLSLAFARRMFYIFVCSDSSRKMCIEQTGV